MREIRQLGIKDQMSMNLVLVKLAPALHVTILSNGVLLNQLLAGATVEAGFDRHRDVFAALDYRDIAEEAEDEEDPIFQLFQGHPPFFRDSNGLTVLRPTSPPPPPLSWN